MLRFFILLFCTAFLTTSCSNEETLFVRIEPVQSGIRFVNTITSTNEMNAFNFTNFYNGGGVGIGDFNNDGLKDVILTGNQVQPALYLNTGNLKFRDVSNQSNVKNNGWVTGVSIIDINQDGWDDIYLSMAAHSSLKISKNQLYINQKTAVPTFKEEADNYGLDYEGFTTQTVFFDYDNDGDLDAYMLNTQPDVFNPNYLRAAVNNGNFPSTDKLFQNQGKNENGEILKFLDVSKEAGIVYEGLGLGVALSDYNNDGFTDIYCSNDFISSDIFYVNQGDGTFKNEINSAMRHTSLYGMGIDAADLNNDLKPDIIQLDMLPEGNERQKQMIAKSDYEKLQLSTSKQYDYTLQYMRNSLQMNLGNNYGTPIFSETGLANGVAKTDWSWSVLLADYDLDGFKDIFISNGYRKNVTDLDFITYKNQSQFGDEASKEARIEGILKDVPEIKLSNYAYRNDSLTGFTDVSKKWGLDESSYANGAVYADLDNDGDLDLIVNNIDSPASVYENTSKINKSVTVKFDGSATGIGAKIIAWNDGKSQFFENFPGRGYLSSVPQEIIIGVGKKAKLDSLQIIWTNKTAKVFYDVGRGTILKPNAANSLPFSQNSSESDRIFSEVTDLVEFTHAASKYVDFNTTPALHKMQTRYGPAINQGDFNNDGKEDLIFGGTYNGSPPSIYLQNELGFKRIIELENSNIEVGDIIVFDADNDKDQDILLIPGICEAPTSNKSAYQPKLYLNDGNANFKQSQKFPSLTVYSRSGIAFDYDNDGDQDLILTGNHLPGSYPIRANSYVLENKNGAFQLVENSLNQALNQLSLVTDLISTDYNQDGDLDLLIVGEWLAPTIIENNNGEFVVKELKNAQKGWWNCVKEIDIDKDGDADYVFGNEGLNSLFRATSEEPVSLLAKDFNQDNKIDPILLHYVQGVEVPFSPLRTLTDQIVQFRSKFISFQSYATATSNELFSRPDLDKVLEKEATELRSMVAINNGNGFSFVPLPNIAQEAPIQDIEVADFNKDGFADLLVSAGFYPNEANLGQQDASYGLLLLGTGKGFFAETNTIETGFFVRGDVRKSVLLPKSKLIVTSVNGGKAVVHKWVK